MGEHQWGGGNTGGVEGMLMAWGSTDGVKGTLVGGGTLMEWGEH